MHRIIGRSRTEMEYLFGYTGLRSLISGLYCRGYKKGFEIKIICLLCMNLNFLIGGCQNVLLHKIA